MASSQVAEHYNARPAADRAERRTSPILHLRNFNNWVKATLLQRATAQTRPDTALDLCCGKGGDLFKWRVAGVRRVLLADIAEASVEEARRKYRRLRAPFRADFVAADCAQERLELRPEMAGARLDLVSCQFALHYSFESLKRAQGLLHNASHMLRPGGLFVGTLPDAYRIMQRLRESPKGFGNSIFRIEPRFSLDETVPLFGAEYDFHLEGVVDCPEFLVYFPILVALAADFDLELVMRMNFTDYFEQNKVENEFLLRKMESLQTVFKRDTEPHERCETFDHARKYFELNDSRVIGTMSRDEWEVASMYCVFIFIKKEKKNRRNDD